MIPKNVEALERRWPGLLVALESAEPMKGGQWRPSRFGPETLAYLDRDGRRRWLHSSFDPVGEGQRLAEAFLSSGASGVAPRAAVMVGHGAGYVFRAMAPRLDRLFVLVTNLGLLRLVCDHHDISDILLDPKIVWIFGSPAELQRRLSEEMSSSSVDMSNAAVILHPPFLELVPPEFSDLIAAVRRIRSGRDTEDQIRPVAESNFRQNFSELDAPGVAEIFGIARGRPAIVAGAGPTLDESLPDLRRLYPTAILIAVDTVAAGLAETDLPPDFVVSVDPRPDSAMHFDALPAAALDRSILVFTPITLPAIVKRFEGRRLVAIPKNHFLLKPAEDALAPKGLLMGGGSVSILAAALAAAMEPACVCLTGVDFRMAGGRFYSRLASYHRSAQDADSRFSSPESLEHQFLDREVCDTPAGVIIPRLQNYASDFRRLVAASVVPFYSLGPAPVAGVRAGVRPCVSAPPVPRPIRIPKDGELPPEKIFDMLSLEKQMTNPPPTPPPQGGRRSA